MALAFGKTGAVESFCRTRDMRRSVFEKQKRESSCVGAGMRAARISMIVETAVGSPGALKLF